MHTRRLVKRSILGSRVYAPSPTGDGAPVTGVVQAVKQENRDVSAVGARRSVYTVLMQDGSLKEFSEDEIAAGQRFTVFVVRCFAAFNRFLHAADLTQSSSNGASESYKVEGGSLSPETVEEHRMVDCKRIGRDPDTRSVSLLEQKRKVVSSSIDVPHARLIKGKAFTLCQYPWYTSGSHIVFGVRRLIRQVLAPEKMATCDASGVEFSSRGLAYVRDSRLDIIHEESDDTSEIEWCIDILDPDYNPLYDSSSSSEDDSGKTPDKAFDKLSREEDDHRRGKCTIHKHKSQRTYAKQKKKQNRINSKRPTSTRVTRRKRSRKVDDDGGYDTSEDQSSDIDVLDLSQRRRWDEEQPRKKKGKKKVVMKKTDGMPDLSAQRAREPHRQDEKKRGKSKKKKEKKTACVHEFLIFCDIHSSAQAFTAIRSEEEVDMDKVTAAMVLTSLSTSPLVRSPPVKVNEGLSGSWKDNGSTGPFTPSSNSSSGGYWSWSAPSDQSNPSTPSPPLSADSFKPFRVPSLGGVGPGPAGPEDPSLDEQDGSSLLFDEPIPRKRKPSHTASARTAVMILIPATANKDPAGFMSPLEIDKDSWVSFTWANYTVLIRDSSQKKEMEMERERNCDSDCSDGEEDFYYTEIKLNTDSVADGLSSLSPVSPSVLSPPPPPPSPLPSINQLSDSHRPPQSSDTKEPHAGGTTPLSRSAPSALYLIHTDHAYQATAPVSIPSSSSNSAGSASTSFTPTNSSSFSISWQSPPVTFTGNTVSPSKSQGFGEQRSQTIAVLSSPPRATTALSRKVRGEGKKCRKVYGMENRDMWCTACRWKKACQRFTD
ncbi:hypothetical protein GBF38_011345 [Nibea albiflora]|uniref:Uncharacterized protein n=1 Tax=Nibea albiflora TaxID=240163 RepID=A0ACB7ESY5_NIBAL|nr:hypothetical protein GBF38_011345 [Nibea albiflora]